MKKIMLSMLSITLMMLLTILFTIPSNNVVAAAPKTLKLSTKTINDPVIVQGDTYDVVASFDGLSDGLTVNWKTVWDKDDSICNLTKYSLQLTISEDTYTCTVYYTGGYDRIKLIATCNEYPELQAICYLDCIAYNPNYDYHYMNSRGEITIQQDYTWNDLFKQFRFNDANNYNFYDGNIVPEIRNANVQYISVLEGCNDINFNNSEYTLDSLVYDFFYDINRSEFEEIGEYRWDNWDDLDSEFDEIGDLYVLFNLDVYYNDIYITTAEIEVFFDCYDWFFDILTGIPGGE